jgi:soluble lytic murein transglycosylase-like protein
MPESRKTPPEVHATHNAHRKPRRRSRRPHARRRAHRRRIQSIFFAASALVPGHQLKSPPKATVTTSYTIRMPAPAVEAEPVALVPPELMYEPLILEAAARYGLDPALIRAVMRVESAFNPLAVSRVGALGLMQLMPEVAEELGVSDVFDPRENVMAGARYLRDLLHRHHGRVELALASYNAGPTAVDRYQAIPPFPETQEYVRAVTSLMRRDHGDAATEDP